MKKVISLILCAVLIVCMTGWTVGDIWSPDAFDTEVKSNYSKTDKVIASNAAYELIWKGSDCTVDLIEKATGNRWGVTARTEGEPTEDPITGMPIKVHPEVSSALIIEVLDRSNNQTAEYQSAVGAVKNGRVVTENIENGIRIFYYFDEIEIRIAVDFVLREDSVAASIDPKLIQEGEGYRVVAAKIAPFWCLNPNDTEDAYIFYPSGSGALVSNESNSAAGIKIQDQVYGFDPVMTRDNLESIKKEVRLPVYGAKNGNLGTCAIIEDNAESCSIGFKVGATGIKYSGVYAHYQIRPYSENYAQSLKAKERMKVYSLSPLEKPVTVAFYPLVGEKANYSGMAETYKNYLKKTGAFSDKAEEESNLNLTFVGGMMINQSFLGVPYKDLVAATTVKGAQSIIKELSEETGVKISAKLLGFGTSGIENNSYAGGMKMNENIGTEKELSALNDFCNQNNVDLYYDFDVVKLKNKSAGYSTFFDTAYNNLLKISTVYNYNAASRSYDTETGYNLLSRGLLNGGSDKVLKKISKWNLSGVSLESLTSLAYSDHSTGDTRYFLKGDMGKDTVALMDKFGEKYKVAAFEANAYAAAAADMIFNTPTLSSQERVFTADVPFYQMIFKGYVPMGTESYNMAVNPKNHLLRTVEAGAGLSYTLIGEYNNEFIDYSGYCFYGSEYEPISDEIIATVNSLKDYYAAINGEEIVSHTILDTGLREVVYGNGVRVYVNYTDASITAPNGTTVEAEAYVWEK